MIQSRARQVHQKEERRQEILTAASELFMTSPFQAITMAELARKSHLGKGTIFIYFNTKEEIFLALAEEGLLSFFEVLDEGLGSSRVPMSAASLANLVVEGLGGQPLLPRLMGILHTVLEHNADRLAILRFKEFLATRVTRTARKLEQRLPFLSRGQALELVLQIQVLILGIGQVSDPAPLVKELLAAPGLHIFDIPFQPFLERTLMALVRGLEQPGIFLPQRSLFEEHPEVEGAG